MERLYMKASGRRKRVLLCGGTNFLGPHLIRRLVERGCEVTVCTRGIHRVPLQDYVKTVVCDCNNDEEGTRRALQGMEADVVIDCISYCPREVYHVLSHVKTSRYIQVSSISVYGDLVTDEERRLHAAIGEERFDPRTFQGWKLDVDPGAGYGIRKKYAECAAYQMFPQCHPVAIRPAYVADPSNISHEQNVRLPELVDWIRRKKRINPANKNYAVCFTRAEEEAELILRLMESDYQEPLNISSEGYVKIQEMVEYIGMRSGVEYFWDVGGESPNFPSGINLNVRRLSEAGFEPSRLLEWFWGFLDTYIDSPLKNYKPWKTVRGTIDTFRGEGVKKVKDHSMEIYRKMSLLLADGIHLADILRWMGLEKVYVYGAGEMGKMALADLSGRMTVEAVFDRAVQEESVITIRKEKTDEYPLCHPAQIPGNDITILITPASMYSQITESLERQGISEKRFLSLNLLLYYGMYYRAEWKHGRGRPGCFFPKKQFLITGAQFSNKGSQAMLYVAMSEIRKRFPHTFIWHCPNFHDPAYKKAEDRYRLFFLFDGRDESSALYELMPRLDGVVDVSGYAFASSGSVNKTDRQVSYLKMARKFRIPVYLMPQSFGPLNYDQDLQRELKELLSSVKVIFARERSGYDLLRERFQLQNVRRSHDLVLQNREIRPEDIFFHVEKLVEKRKKFCLPEKENVALIPNSQNYKYGNPKDVLKIYQEMISALLAFQKEIYIISHSEDEALCEEIYEPYKEQPEVHLYEEKYDCLEFCELVKNFQYMAASRFHAVVHAYKQHVPCVVIGWADKYRELLALFGQERFWFDVRNQMDIEAVAAALEDMNCCFEKEAEKIASILPEIQAENCFDILE